MENLRILPSVEDAKRDLSVDRENQSQGVDADDANLRGANMVARRPRERGAGRRLVARRDVAGTGWMTTT
tara:strand:+ start:7080 stop:7289 length:210 start_codon:yes stop_codon:yes gene_type:complete